MKTFIVDLKRALKKRQLSDSTIEEIVRDYDEMIHTGLEEGMSEEEILKKFGSVEHVAEELARVETSDPKANADEETFIKRFDLTEDTYCIEVKLPTENVTYQQGEDNAIVITANRALDEKDYTFRYANHRLTIIGPRAKGFGLFNLLTRHLHTAITITLPSKATCERLHHKATNGHLTFKAVTIGDVRINNVNGDVAATQSTLNDIVYATVNGDLMIEDTTVNSLTTNAVNGDVMLTKTTIKGAMHHETVSGDAMLKQVTCASFDMSAVSGDLTAEEFYPESYKAHTVSGDVLVKNRKDHAITKENTRTLSGEFRVDA